MKQAVQVASGANAAFELSRAKGNLASHLWLRGSLAEADLLWEEAHADTGRYGQVGFGRWMIGIKADKKYALGRWDEALALAEPFIADVEAGAPHYLAPQAYLTRAFIGLARGDNATILSDAERALTLARRAKDPQILYLTLAGAAHVLRESGDRPAADELADEFLAPIAAGDGLGFSIVWVHVLSWTLTEGGRGPELAVALCRHAANPWVRAAIAFAEGDPAGAAEICSDMGVLTEEAYARLAAARLLTEQGRRAAADDQLRRALGFYRSVGAKRYVQEGEALLAASA
jgi:tetratricopeptide (TPR) repeat protein